MSIDIKTNKFNYAILLGGTSGTGKSTIANKLAERLNLDDFVSTDTLREQLRNEVPSDKCPILHASSYYAGEYFIPNNNNSNIFTIKYNNVMEEKTIKGYELQNEIIFPMIESKLRNSKQKERPIIIEGVHLSIKNILQIKKQYNYVIPSLIYLKDQVKIILNLILI